MAAWLTRHWRSLLLVALLIALAGLLTQMAMQREQRVTIVGRLADSVEVSIGGRTFELELAMTEAERYQGLSDRTSIPKDGGMLFVYPEPAEVSFVMRRCYVPIDLVYLDADCRVVATYEMQVEPYDTPNWQLKRYPSGEPIVYVLELRSGTIAALGIKRQQSIPLPTDQLKGRASW